MHLLQSTPTHTRMPPPPAPSISTPKTQKPTDGSKNNENKRKGDARMMGASRMLSCIEFSTRECGARGDLQTANQNTRLLRTRDAHLTPPPLSQCVLHNTHTNAHTHTHTHIHTHTHTNTHSNTHNHTQTHTNTHILYPRPTPGFISICQIHWRARLEKAFSSTQAKGKARQSFSCAS